jgi:polyisoprenyl-phosphate glycosyltransferase
MINPQINIVVPLYNEEEVFPTLINRLHNLMKTIEATIEIILVDDGSNDNTPYLIYDLAMRDDRFHAIFLSRNFGHQYALSCGLKHVNAIEAIFIIDADLQDPPEMLPLFYQKYLDGYQVVYGIRKGRKESFLKRISYKLFYRSLKSVSSVNIPLDSGDFCLLSRGFVNALNSLPEQSRFLRGMRAWLGYKQIGVEYNRESSQAGQSKYTWSELWRLAYNGLFNFSEFPVRFIFRIGLTAVIISVCYLLYVLIMKYYFNSVPEGFTALLFIIVLFGGIQLIALSMIGEYVLRIFFQVKGRPLYIVSKRIYKRQVLDG